MKASLKFREGEKPLFRAKMPLSISSLPFRFGIVAGGFKELNLNLATFFKSGPSLKIAYHPNNPANPFTVSLKIHSDSVAFSASNSVQMSAGFNFPKSGNPNFALHLKPQLGDFEIKKSYSTHARETISVREDAESSDDDGSAESVESSEGDINNTLFKRRKSRTDTQYTGHEFLSGVETAVRTSIPLPNQTLLKFKWGVNLDSGVRRFCTGRISLNKFPFLALNKIGIERLYSDNSDSNSLPTPKPGDFDSEPSYRPPDHRLELHNTELRKELDNLRQELTSLGSQFCVTGSGFGKKQELAMRNGTKLEVDNGDLITGS